ncbi:LutC/YkgG family protein [Pelobium manganitolerans]|uniref:LutC/YkgG family protein n=1 Tax=Pelobium manganitolerans TaxID=1842495 RepID=UPI003FA35785
MTSKEQILAAVKASQPDLKEMPSLDFFYQDNLNQDEDLAQFIQTVEFIGAKTYRVNSYEEIIAQLQQDFDLKGKRVISPLNEFSTIAEKYTGADNHTLADAELIILPTHFAVAENGACWVDDHLFDERLMLFIPQHLAFVLKKEEVVPTMHRAYERIAGKSYGYGAFVAGPSKTADIEQSLVLGAHGPRSLRVFII